MLNGVQSLLFSTIDNHTMKKHSIVIFTAATLLLATACTNTTEKIRETAYQYSFALANYRVDDAASYCTQETQESTLQYASHLLENVPAEYIASDTPATIEIKDITMTSDTTATVVYHKTTPIKDFDGSLGLVKRGKEWLAHDPMESTVNNREPEMVADTVTIRGKKIQLFHTAHPDTTIGR